MRNLIAAVMCTFALSAVAMPNAYSCDNGKCPMKKEGKKCDHKKCPHCQEHAKKAKEGAKEEEHKH